MLANIIYSFNSGIIESEVDKMSTRPKCKDCKAKMAPLFHDRCEFCIRDRVADFLSIGIVLLKCSTSKLYTTRLLIRHDAMERCASGLKFFMGEMK